MATAVAQVAAGFVVGIDIVDGGSGYTDTPDVMISDASGSGASAVATVVDGSVTAITVNNPGQGYTSPRITVGSIVLPPRQASATSRIINGFVFEVNLTDGGFGYKIPPNVILSGGGGVGAAAIASVVDGIVTKIIIVSPGRGYTSEPIVQIAPPPFDSRLSVVVSKVNLVLNLVVGAKYQIEGSVDLVDWSPIGPAFIAQEPRVVREVDVTMHGRYFRMNLAP